MISIGDNAPQFTLSTNGEGQFSLADAAGKYLILYFYPKDDTPGCTKEAIGFSEASTAFDAQNAMVVGVSRDTVKKHDKFVGKHDLRIPLISDEEGSLCEAFSTWVEKSMYGKTYMGIERATFLISPDGKVLHIWRKVKVPGHVEEVLAQLQSLKS
ncbi:Peroxiredoxin Bcp [Rhodobacteraceae bacterium IMCC1933]|nr:peroxiredoxin [Paracoccaceae bacterium]MDP4063211.1 Peroxiredoxin Bcp [Rhodobacteraceae bacterium IMCC1923]MDP4067288.1 Peroxiredoxin Bcp [Rhodobacteraceae bacterium IMCC1933]MDP4070488.1 Peroxiredoxin Bcp [Rhodobacteraceae bacterium IMCC1909]